MYLLFINILVIFSSGYNLYYIIHLFNNNYNISFILINNMLNILSISFMNYITHISPHTYQLSNYILNFNILLIFFYVFMIYLTFTDPIEDNFFSIQFMLNFFINSIFMITLILFYNIIVFRNKFEYFCQNYLCIES